MLVISLVIGVLFGVGVFLLPNTLEISRSTVIERPRASVFAMINDLRIAREWSPYNARDPDADYTISDTPGPGQSMRWISNVREVGSGRMVIVDNGQNEFVETVLTIGDRASLNSRIELRPIEEGTRTEWLVTAECGAGAINVPCRYMNLIMRSTIERDLDDGLERLKDRAEQLPVHDFEGYDIMDAQVEAQTVIFVDVTIAKPNPTLADRNAAEAQGIESLDRFFAQNAGQTPIGRTLIRVFPPNNGVGGVYRFSVGYPYNGPAPLLVGVRAGQTPEGAALRASFVGPRSQVPMMYSRLEAYRQAHRIALRPGAEAWEIATPEPQPPGADPADPVERTEIFYPIE
ncbi:MAG: SRPBCC family protein [Hyphomonadaceae bacterium]|nr:SRPBCC family protein [Hyphomonadaceae bacterium]